MFFLRTLTKELEIQPRFLGQRLREEIERRLRQEVEGTCSGEHGFVLVVTSITSVGRGLVREGSGAAAFAVEYQSVSFMPQRGEVLDAVVKSVNKMGFFAEAGPLTVFVSNHLVPDDFEFDAAGEPAYATPDGEQRVAAGAEVRLRVMGTRVDANEVFAVGTIKDDFLGVIGAGAA